MRILATTALPTLLDFGGATRAPLGRLFTPRMRGNIEGTVRSGLVYAADNDCYNGLDLEAWLRLVAWLELDGATDRLAFVTVPDVVGDAAATLDRFRLYAGDVPERLPRGFVLQDGSEAAGLVPWNEIASVFIGGSTEWKVGAEAAALAAEAKARGLYVHVGRVNTASRIERAFAMGADSIDGSSFGRFPKKYLPAALELVSELNGSDLERGAAA